MASAAAAPAERPAGAQSEADTIVLATVKAIVNVALANLERDGSDSRPGTPRSRGLRSDEPADAAQERERLARLAAERSFAAMVPEPAAPAAQDEPGQPRRGGARGLTGILGIGGGGDPAAEGERSILKALQRARTAVRNAASRSRRPSFDGNDTGGGAGPAAAPAVGSAGAAGGSTDENSGAAPPAGAPDGEGKGEGKGEGEGGPAEAREVQRKPSLWKGRLVACGQRSILNDRVMSALAPSLPALLRLKSWRCTYKLSRHGASFSTLFNQCRGLKQTLLVLRTTQDEVLGAFASSPWVPTKEDAQYYGNGQTFIFRVAEGGTAVDAYCWTRRNSHFQLCTPSSISLGAGGDIFGLSIGRDSNGCDLCAGVSGPCATFANEPLAPRSGVDFAVHDLEVWAVSDGAQASRRRR